MVKRPFVVYALTDVAEIHNSWPEDDPIVGTPVVPEGNQVLTAGDTVVVQSDLKEAWSTLMPDLD